jgi:hypothetical protein
LGTNKVKIRFFHGLAMKNLIFRGVLIQFARGTSDDITGHRLYIIYRGPDMKCFKCGARLHELNHHFVPAKNGGEGRRYCIICAREEQIITLV